MPEPIPGPTSYPIVGTYGVIDPAHPGQSFKTLAATYGPIFRLSLFGRQMIIVSSQKIVNELCDESRFYKKVDGALEVVRNGAGDGLFTAYDGEENWGTAHRILMPAFGPQKILGMFQDMLDINSQLILKWERFGPDYAIDPSEDFTRLAFDTIGLTAMSHRFNSFYTPDLPPFIGAMGRFLTESGARSQRPAIVQRWMTSANKQYEEDIALMVGVCDNLVAQRRAHPNDKQDLLNALLNGKDPKTGRQLPDANIRNQLITFLIAGHETTSGLLSFTMYYLLSNPRTYEALQAEIDAVVGTEPLQLSHLPKLQYTAAVLRESLRLNPPAGMIKLAPRKDELLDGKYEIKADTGVAILISQLHRDPEVYGDDAEDFRPERMLQDAFEALPPNSWKPFGNGARACIGRPLAWQESLMMLATLFQKFDFRFDDPSYHLRIKQTLTVKPTGFKIHAIPRKGAPPVSGPGGAVAIPMQAMHAIAQAQEAKQKTVATVAGGVPIYVYFGSNTGSCEGFAQSVAADAASHGFSAKIGTLDEVTKLKEAPRDGPAVIITASYEGQPADNAAHFVQALTSLPSANLPLKGVKYAVFGAGNHDWARTYQRIPTLIDDTLAECGAERLMKRGVGDAGGADLFGEFDRWEKELWEVLAKSYDTSKAKAQAAENDDDDLVVEVTGTTRNIRLRQPDLSLGRVVANRLLTAPGAAPKRHIEFALPDGMSYRAGDYLAILPTNPPESVRRVLHRFKLAQDEKITIHAKGPTTLPTGEPITFFELFSEYVELGQPATSRTLDDLGRYAPKEGEDAEKFKQLVANAKTEIFDKRLSVLDLLEKVPSINIPLNQFIKILPSMRIRQYSISSSPLWKPDHCTLTVSIVRGLTIDTEGEFIGVCSNYLANLQPGDEVSMGVRPSSTKFHLPADPSIPIVMFCAGSGFAPMRGFIQDRYEQIVAGRTVGKALLFVGCRGPEEDFLYANAELAQWIDAGAVDVRPAFSRHPELSEGCHYVQDRIWKDRQDLVKAWKEGARFYTCGMSPMSNSIRQKCIELIAEQAGWNTEKAEEWFQTEVQERYSTDVFG